jgi:hypothetical protein
MAYQILNYLGEEIIASVTEEQLEELKTDVLFNYFQYDATPENDLVTRWANEEADEKGSLVQNCRIVKPIQTEE